MNVCPVCGGDRDKDRAEIKRIVRAHGFITEVVNPAGRVLIFRRGWWRKISGKDRLQLGDQCNACDEATIRKFLGIK